QPRVRYLSRTSRDTSTTALRSVRVTLTRSDMRLSLHQLGIAPVNRANALTSRTRKPTSNSARTANMFCSHKLMVLAPSLIVAWSVTEIRSEERRVGKECIDRCAWCEGEIPIRVVV